MSEIKQMLVIRGDRVKKMKSGKLAVQLSHASNAFMALKWLSGLEPSEDERKWLSDDLSVKIVLEVSNEAELQMLHTRTKMAGLESHLITDAGLTVFPEPTVTCLAIGPDLATKINPFTEHLKLFYGK